MGAPLPESEPSIDNCKMLRWLAVDPSTRHVKEKLLARAQGITHRYFSIALQQAAATLNDLLGRQKYCAVWGPQPHSSPRWVSELARRWIHANRAYATYTDEPRIEDKTRALEHAVDKHLTTFAYMNDAAYSGSQTVTRINAMRSTLKIIGVNDPNILVVIPYVTHTAQQRIGEVAHLISTEIIEQIDEFLTPEERTLCASDVVEGRPVKGWAYGTTFFAHCIPDTHSLDSRIARLLKDAPQPPYKKKDTTYYSLEDQDFKKYRAGFKG